MRSPTFHGSDKSEHKKGDIHMRTLWVIGFLAILVAAVSTGFAASRQPKAQDAAPTQVDPVPLIHRLEAKLDKIERKLDATDPEHKRLAEMVAETEALLKRFAEISVEVYGKMERKADAAEAKLDRIERTLAGGLHVINDQLDHVNAHLARLEAKLDRLEAKADRTTSNGG